MIGDFDQPARAAQALADPLRLALLRRLLNGPAAVAELVAETGQSQSKVSNHLALLREQRLVATSRHGRQISYRIASASVAQLVEALLKLTSTPRRPRQPAPIALARTCYDHLAGLLGVSLFDALVAAEALERPAETRADVRLGRAGPALFCRLGVDPAALAGRKRRFAYACLDWTERRQHLGGALAAALCSAFESAGWIERESSGRTVRLTEPGRAGLRESLGIELVAADSTRAQEARTSPTG